MPTVRRSTPATLTPLTVEQRIAKAARKAELAALAAAEAQGTVDGALDGTEVFTALNVDGTDVSPFLGKTDGEKLVESSGLQDELVLTAKVAADAITNQAAAETSATLTLGGTTETTVQTVSYTTTGGRLEVRANFFLTVWHPAGGDTGATIRVKRDGVTIFEQYEPAINGDLLQGWWTPIVVDTPVAGSYTWTVTVTVDNNDADTQTASARFLSVTEFKR